LSWTIYILIQNQGKDSIFSANSSRQKEHSNSFYTNLGTSLIAWVNIVVISKQRHIYWYCF